MVIATDESKAEDAERKTHASDRNDCVKDEDEGTGCGKDGVAVLRLRPPVLKPSSSKCWLQATIHAWIRVFAKPFVQRLVDYASRLEVMSSKLSMATSVNPEGQVGRNKEDGTTSQSNKWSRPQGSTA